LSLCLIELISRAMMMLAAAQNFRRRRAVKARARR